MTHSFYSDHMSPKWARLGCSGTTSFGKKRRTWRGSRYVPGSHVHAEVDGAYVPSVFTRTVYGSFMHQGLDRTGLLLPRHGGKALWVRLVGLCAQGERTQARQATGHGATTCLSKLLC